jgi:putative ABC transport system ATP-binding protein
MAWVWRFDCEWLERMTAFIRFDHVTVTLRNKPLLSDISFSLNPGEKAVLQGRSGSGKSSVLKALLGFFPLAQGDIFFQGESLSPCIARKIRTSAAYIGQEPILGADTVREALELPFRFKAHRDRPPTELALIEILDAFHLPADILNQPCSRVSVGEKQRIALARAKLLGKRLYLLDEVTSALDRESKAPVFKLLADPELTVLSVAHDPDWIAQCGTVLELVDGRLAGESHVADA